MLMRKKSSLTFPIKQVPNIALENTQASNSMNLDDSKDKVSKSDLKAPPEMDCSEVQSIITHTKKTKNKESTR